MSSEQLTDKKPEKKMNDTDGIIISDRPSWEHSVKELFLILWKRIIALPSKLIGFKPLCLLIATWLLTKGHIRDWIWFCVLTGREILHLKQSMPLFQLL